MKKLVTMVVAAVTVSTVVASPVRAAEIEIVNLKAIRFGADTATKNPHIYLSAFLKNTTAAKTTGGRYIIYQGNGTKMVQVVSRNMNDLDPGNSELVGIAVPSSSAEQHFELRVLYKGKFTIAKTTLAAAKTYLTLISLKCLVANEGNDTPELRVYMPGKEHKMRWENVNAGMTLKIKGFNKEVMTRDVSVQLWEIDSGSPDDKIGIRTILRDSLGEKTLKFSGKEGSYVLKYRVDAE